MIVVKEYDNVLFGVSDNNQYLSAEEVEKSLGEKLAKRRWENAFQKWSDNNGMSDGAESWGACGYGSMCEYCKDNSYGRPCVRALNAMLRETGKHIDYTDFDFVKVWEDGGITFGGARA